MQNHNSSVLHVSRLTDVITMLVSPTQWSEKRSDPALLDSTTSQLALTSAVGYMYVTVTWLAYKYPSGKLRIAAEAHFIAFLKRNCKFGFIFLQSKKENKLSLCRRSTIWETRLAKLSLHAGGWHPTSYQKLTTTTIIFFVILQTIMDSGQRESTSYRFQNNNVCISEIIWIEKFGEYGEFWWGRTPSILLPTCTAALPLGASVAVAARSIQFVKNPHYKKHHLTLKH